MSIGILGGRPNRPPRVTKIGEDVLVDVIRWVIVMLFTLWTICLIVYVAEKRDR